MTLLRNRRKPWRGHPGENTVHAIRLHVRQDAVVDPAEAKGTVSQLALRANLVHHFGTIPAGAFILPAYAHVITPFAAGTVDIGPEDDIASLLPAAALDLTGAGFRNVVVGPRTGYTDRDLEVCARLSANSATGEFDILIPFYVNAD